MNRLLNKITRRLRPFGLQLTYTPRIDRIKVTSKCGSKPKGKVLLSYIIDPFLLGVNESISNTHTHHWESHQIAKTFTDRGYDVDIVSYLNQLFVPRVKYDFFIGARTNFSRISRYLNADCVKAVHLDTAHWITSNHAGYKRLLELKKRRGHSLHAQRMIEENFALEVADCATVLGNRFTIDSYAYAQKPIYRIPISAPAQYDFPDDREIEISRDHYVWFGSQGFIHKGLDLTLEAFARMPDKQLTVCGPIDQGYDPAFQQAFHKELYETPNIKTAGWVDVEGELFRSILKKSIGIVYPTCSEGGGGSVISCMHGGLIPLVSYESSVDIDDFGVMLNNSTVDDIINSVTWLSNRPADDLARRTRQAWLYARKTHTKDSFSTAYANFVDSVLIPMKNQ